MNNKASSFFFILIFFSFIVFAGVYHNAHAETGELIKCEVADGPCPPSIAGESVNNFPTPEEMGWGAEEETGITGVSCFDYYHFQSVQVSVGTDKNEYYPGENVQFKGKIINENDYPVVDGYVFVRISKYNSNYTTEGHNIVDEFFAAEKMSLDAGAEKEIDFKWKAPAGIPAGDYRADYFFSVGKKFNLGGLPFSNEVIVGSSDFKINSSESSWVYFDRSATKINDVAYHHIGDWPILESGSQVVVSQPIKNTTGENKIIKVKYDLYWWDSLNETDKITSSSEDVMVAADSSETLSYTISSINQSVYYLKITADDSGQKSIVNIRITSNMERPRLNYPAITKFPLMKGDDFTLFSCFHNTSTVNTEGKILVDLFDKNGNHIDGFEYNGGISSAMMADKKDLVSQDDYDYIKLRASVIDRNGKDVDSYEAEYDCNAINPDKCRKSNILFLYGLIGLIAFIAVIILIMNRKNKAQGALLIFAIIGIMGFAGFASSAHAYNQQSSTVSNNYTHYLDAWQPCGRTVASGVVSVTHKIDMTAGDYNVKIGDDINFTYNPDLPFFSAYSGAWDTPYGAWCAGNSYCKNVLSGQAISNGSAPNQGYILWNASKPSVSMSSDNSSVVQCSGMSCQAVGDGVATITANIPQTQARLWSIIRDDWCANNFPSCQPVYGNGWLNGQLGWYWLSESSESGLNCQKENKMNLPASSSMSWTITVASLKPVVDLTAAPDTVAYNSPATLSWTSSNADSCTAFGGWSGDKAVSGSQSTGPLTTATTYSLTCTNSYGESTASVTVNVGAPQHTVCQNNSCVIESGVGSNECQSSYNCGGGGGSGGGQWHTECAQNSCTAVSGPGYNKCNFDYDCGGVNGSSQFYGLCVQNSCVKISGQAPEGVETCGNYGGACGAGVVGDTYSLYSSNDLNITISGDTGVFCSNSTNITIDNLGTGFNAAVHLSVSNWGGLHPESHAFSVNPVTNSKYSSGSNFSLCVNAADITEGAYDLIISGDGGGVLRSVMPPIKLHILQKSPSWKEVRAWKNFIAGLFDWM